MGRMSADLALLWHKSVLREGAFLLAVNILHFKKMFLLY